MISQNHLRTAKTAHFATSPLLTETLLLITIFREYHIVNPVGVSSHAYINRYDMYIYVCTQQCVQLLLVHEICNNSAVT
jgi:hypothetical protein